MAEKTKEIEKIYKTRPNVPRAWSPSPERDAKGEAGEPPKIIIVEEDNPLERPSLADEAPELASFRPAPASYSTSVSASSPSTIPKHSVPVDANVEWNTPPIPTPHPPPPLQRPEYPIPAANAPVPETNLIQAVNFDEVGKSNKKQKEIVKKLKFWKKKPKENITEDRTVISSSGAASINEFDVLKKNHLQLSPPSKSGSTSPRRPASNAGSTVSTKRDQLSPSLSIKTANSDTVSIGGTSGRAQKRKAHKTPKSPSVKSGGYGRPRADPTLDDDQRSSPTGSVRTTSSIVGSALAKVVPTGKVKGQSKGITRPAVPQVSNDGRIEQSEKTPLVASTDSQFRYRGEKSLGGWLARFNEPVPRRGRRSRGLVPLALMGCFIMGTMYCSTVNLYLKQPQGFVEEGYKGGHHNEKSPMKNDSETFDEGKRNESRKNLRNEESKHQHGKNKHEHVGDHKRSSRDEQNKRSHSDKFEKGRQQKEGRKRKVSKIEKEKQSTLNKKRKDEKEHGNKKGERNDRRSMTRHRKFGKNKNCNGSDCQDKLTPVQWAFIEHSAPAIAAVLAPIIGSLAEFTPRLFLFLGLFLLGGAYVAYGFISLITSSTIYLGVSLLLRFVQGFGSSAFAVAVFAILAVECQGNMGMVTAMALGSVFAGFTLGPVIYDGFTQVSDEYDITSWILGGIAVALSIVCCPCLNVINGRMADKWLGRSPSMFSSVFLWFLASTAIVSGMSASFYSCRLFKTVNEVTTNVLYISLLIAGFVILFLLTLFIFGALMIVRKAAAWSFAIFGLSLTATGYFIAGPIPLIQFKMYLWSTGISAGLLAIGLGLTLSTLYSGMLDAANKVGRPESLRLNAHVAGLFIGCIFAGVFSASIFADYAVPTMGWRWTTSLIASLNIAAILIGTVYKGWKVFVRWKQNFDDDYLAGAIVPPLMPYGSIGGAGESSARSNEQKQIM